MDDGGPVRVEVTGPVGELTDRDAHRIGAAGFPGGRAGYAALMVDDSNHAEQLDPSVLGERVGDDGRPGDDFPPDEPLGVDDPSIVEQGIIARDDVEARDARREGDDDTGVAPPGLIDPSGDDVDREPQLVADESPSTEPAAEAAAVHTVDDDAPGS